VEIRPVGDQGEFPTRAQTEIGLQARVGGLDARRSMKSAEPCGAKPAADIIPCEAG
jgi:hypothetical protein